ncbi:hypothetical protein NQ318_012531, partial [Aromia moschata]
MALRNLNVIELAGLAPVPFCGMILADFGATVVRVDKIGHNTDLDCLGNGKMSISLNLKNQKGARIIRDLCKTSDVLIEPFRKGVMEKLGLGPDVLLKDNPKLIYARLTGYGQSGYYSERAGHDINYIALSGLLSLFGRHDEKPVPPVNIVADFGGGGLMCTMGILLALLERKSSGLGQVVDCSMEVGYTDLRIYLSGEKNVEKTYLTRVGTFMKFTKTKDGKYISVGALEPQFYTELLKGLNLTEEEAPQFSDCDKLKRLFTEKFMQKTQQEWCDIFDNAPKHKHNSTSGYFVKTNTQFVPAPAPKLSRTPGQCRAVKNPPKRGQHTREVLSSLGLTAENIDQLENEGVIECCQN